MDNQTREDLEQVQDILEQRIHELTHGDDYAFRVEPLPKLKDHLGKRALLSVLLMVTKGVLLTCRENKPTDTNPPEVLRA